MSAKLRVLSKCSFANLEIGCNFPGIVGWVPGRRGSRVLYLLLRLSSLNPKKISILVKKRCLHFLDLYVNE